MYSPANKTSAHVRCLTVTVLIVATAGCEVERPNFEYVYLPGTEIEYAVEDVVDLVVGEAGAVEPGGFDFPVTEPATSEEFLGEVWVIGEGTVIDGGGSLVIALIQALGACEVGSGEDGIFEERPCEVRP